MDHRHRLRERLSQRLAQLSLAVTSDEIDRLVAYLELLKLWNQKVRLTSLDLDDGSTAAIDRLVAEPAAARDVLGSSGQWFDLGSGGGSPAIPLKILNPATELTMVESRERKGAFLREVVRELDLPLTTVRTERIERLEDSGVNWVTVRAVALDDSVLQPASRLLSPEGRLLLFGSGSQDLNALHLERYGLICLGRRDSPGLSTALTILGRRTE